MTTFDLDKSRNLPKGTITLQSEGDKTLICIGEKRVPVTLYPRQLGLALLQRGITEEDVAAKVATLTPEQQRIARIEMKGHVYERLSPWIGIIGAMLGLTESDMDDVFIAGAGL